MSKKHLKYCLYFSLILVMLIPLSGKLMAKNSATDSIAADSHLDIKAMILEHLADSYEWHIATINNKDISISLPVILYSKTSGIHLFSSKKIQQSDSHYKGFYISQDGQYKGKIVENDANGTQIRPIDFSITKNAASLLIASCLLIIIFLSIARAYKRDPMGPKKGIVGAIEMFVLSIHDDIIKPVIGEDYKKYRYYLLALFFFIFFNNILGLIPIFPGGANVTGNIAVTFTLALFTFVIVNFTGTKTYYKDVFWPDVPIWLKPIMMVIEVVGLITKPFALMIRLFANIMSGHAIVLGLISLIFVTAHMGSALNSSLTGFSIFLVVFISFLEILVAYIQAYVFTVFTAVFINAARAKPQVEKKKN